MFKYLLPGLLVCHVRGAISLSIILSSNQIKNETAVFWCKRNLFKKKNISYGVVF